LLLDILAKTPRKGCLYHNTDIHVSDLLKKQ